MLSSKIRDFASLGITDFIYERGNYVRLTGDFKYGEILIPAGARVGYLGTADDPFPYFCVYLEKGQTLGFRNKLFRGYVSISREEKFIEDGELAQRSVIEGQSFEAGELVVFTRDGKLLRPGKIDAPGKLDAPSKLDAQPTVFPARQEREELKGDQRLGTLIYIRQFHNRDEFDAETKKRAGRYQFEILKELAARKSLHVFVESLYEDLTPENIYRKEPISEFNAIRGIFHNTIPKNPSNLQINVLAEYGAANVYAALNEKVYLHATLTKDESDTIDDEIKRGINVGENILTRREELATQNVIYFMKSNPGKTVVLIYGGEHEFVDDFKRAAFEPMVISVNFGSRSVIK